MCLARVRFDESPASAEPVMIDVERIEATEQGLVLTGLLGESRTIRGSVKMIDFMESVVWVEKGKD